MARNVIDLALPTQTLPYDLSRNTREAGNHNLFNDLASNFLSRPWPVPHGVVLTV